MPHQKPTSEELQANIEKSQAELDKIDKPEEAPATTPESTPVEVTPAPVVEPNPAPKEEPAVDPKPPVESEKPKEEPKEENEDKVRLRESTREAQVLHLQNERKDKAIADAATLPEPTEEELKIEAVRQGFNYEDMTAVEIALFKKSVHNEMKLAKIANVAKEGKDIIEWHGKVDSYIDDPKVKIKHPELEGKEEEFKIFASKKTRRGADLDDLTSLFLFEYEKNKPKNKGQMFPTGKGGPNTPEPKKDDKLTVEQGRLLMQTNFNEFRKKLKEGQIATE